MNRNIENQNNKIKKFWSNLFFSKKGMLLIFIIFIIGLPVFFLISGRDNFVPLYSNLATGEMGELKKELVERGVKSEVRKDGFTLLVPYDDVNSLKVELAIEGYPKKGSIAFDLSAYTHNGMTENENKVVKLDAIQTELANLLKKNKWC